MRNAMIAPGTVSQGTKTPAVATPPTKRTLTAAFCFIFGVSVPGGPGWRPAAHHVRFYATSPVTSVTLAPARLKCCRTLRDRAAIHELEAR